MWLSLHRNEIKYVASRGVIKATLISARKEIEIVNILCTQNEHHCIIVPSVERTVSRDTSAKCTFVHIIRRHIRLCSAARPGKISRSYYPFRGALISTAARVAWTPLERVSIHRAVAQPCIRARGALYRAGICKTRANIRYSVPYPSHLDVDFKPAIALRLSFHSASRNDPH